MNPLSALARLGRSQRSAWSICLSGVTVFCYQISEVLGKHSTFGEFATPPAWGEVMLACAAGLAAVIGAAAIRPERRRERGPLPRGVERRQRQPKPPPPAA